MYNECNAAMYYVKLRHHSPSKHYTEPFESDIARLPYFMHIIEILTFYRVNEEYSHIGITIYWKSIV